MRNDEGVALGWHVPAFQAEERAAGYAPAELPPMTKPTGQGSRNKKGFPSPRKGSPGTVAVVDGRSGGFRCHNLH
jgi:hypothetical protein